MSIEAASMRARLWTLLGGFDREPRAVSSRTLRHERRQSFELSRLALDFGDGSSVPALLVMPHDHAVPVPAVLYCHAHGNRYDIGKSELIEGRPSLRKPAYADVLAGLGIAGLSLDMPTFGERSGETESALAKACHWQGRTLFGAMLRDLRVGLDFLCGHQAIDARRIATFGISMGSTHAWWLAALDPRVAAVAELCCLADVGTLIETGAHDLHGPYMTVPGLGAEFATGAIAALVAPRPFLSCTGLRDPLTPERAVRAAHDTIAAGYAALGASQQWQPYCDPGSGHEETADMRRRVIAFLQAAL